MRYKLIPIERYVNRAAAYALVILFIGALYGLVYMASQPVIEGGKRSLSFWEMGTMLVLILGTQPLYKFLQRWVDGIFYGGWYDDLAATRQISQALTQVEGGTYNIAITLCQTLQKTMQLEYANLLLGDGRLISTESHSANTKEAASFFTVDEVMNWFQVLYMRTGREIGPGKELVEILSVSDPSKRWLLGYKPQFWLFLGGKNSPQGLLVLGTRRGGAELAPKDLEILEVVIHQAGVALENEYLLREMRRQAEQNRALNRQIFHAREDERKRIARDLHDHTIQTLVGVNYQLADARAQAEPKIGSKLSPTMVTLREVISDLRQICADLRPPALDALGLVPTIQSRVTELQAQVSFEIELFVDERLNEIEISDDTSLCIYRFFHEAIVNVQKHAAADWALLSMRAGANNEIVIVVEDDGKGFSPPPKLELLVETRHFGLIGIKEQVEAIGGQLHIDSSPEHGCRLSASLPLKY